MNNRIARSAIVTLAAVLAISAGFWLHPWNRSAGPAADSGSVAPLIAASLPDLNGKSQALGQWRGRVMVVNFWATWCQPCLEEIPEFVRIQEEHGSRGLQFVGIAIDNVDKVREFAAKYKMNYPVLIGESDAIELATMAGNKLGGLPFTVLIDRNGQLIGTELGRLNGEKLLAIVEPAM